MITKRLCGMVRAEAIRDYGYGFTSEQTNLILQHRKILEAYIDSSP